MVNIIKDALLRLNLSISKVRGQCYDGASAMRSVGSGVAKQICDMEKRVIYTHCYGHTLDLACSDTIKTIKLMGDSFDTAREITKLIKHSPCCDDIFKKLKAEISPGFPGICALCPTRWSVRPETLQSIPENFETLQSVCEEASEYVNDSGMKDRIRGVSTHMRNFDFFSGTMLGHLILSHGDNLSRTLQGTDISASEGQNIVKMTVKVLESLRTEANFTLFWSNVNLKRRDSDVMQPSLPRKCKTPARYEVGNAEAEFHETVEDQYRQIYYQAIDTVVGTT